MNAVKEVSLKDTVFDMVAKHPEVREVIISLGFTPLSDDKMLHTAGRMMTLGRAAKQFGIPYETIVQTLEKNGFTVKESEL